jgi:exosortase/archaeosortase family protein
MSLHCAKDALLRYLFCYGVWAGALFALIFFEGFSPFHFINELQTLLTIRLTNLWIDAFNIPVHMFDEKMIFEHGLELLIANSCNGMTPILLFVAGALSYPTDYQSKIVWILSGYVALTSINMLRIYLITLWVIENPQSFDFTHDFVGRYVVGTITLLLFYLFTQRVKVVYV